MVALPARAVRPKFAPAPARLAKIGTVLTRRATLADVEPFKALVDRTSKDDLQLRFFGRPNVSDAFIQAQLFPREPGAAWVVYEQGDQGRMLGHALLLPDGSSKAEIAILMSAGGGKGTGLAKMLIADAQSYAASRGIQEVHALIDRQNGPVKGLLMKAGFTRQGAWDPGEDPLYVWLAPRAG